MKLYCFVKKSLSPPILTDQDMLKQEDKSIVLHGALSLSMKVYTAHENK